MKSLNIQDEGLNWEASKEWSLEAEINTEKAEELTVEDLEGMKGKDAEFQPEVSGGISMPLNSTTALHLKAQKDPEFHPNQWQAQSDTKAQIRSANTPVPIANFVPSAQEGPKSRKQESLCHWDNLRSRVALVSSRCAALFEEIERERVLRPEGVDEKLSTWISRRAEQIREGKELKLEMEALEEKYWEADWLVKEKICLTEIKIDRKREEGLESELDVSGEGSIPNTTEPKVSAQSASPSPTPPPDDTASAKNHPIFCFKEWNILFDTFCCRAALDQEIDLLEPQSRTVNQLRSWIALMDEIVREGDVLKEEIVLHEKKVGEHLRGLDVESSWRRGYDKALSRRINKLKGVLEFYERKDLQCLGEEMEIKMRMKEVSDVASASDPIDIALAETESSIAALLSTYRKAEISSLNSALSAQPFPGPSDACSSKKPAFLAAADETKRALEDYVRTMKEEEELRAMREKRGVLGSVTRDLYENSSTAKETGAIAAGGDDQIPRAEEENTTTTPAGVEILNADEDEARDAGRLKYASATTTARETPQHNVLWPWAVPLLYAFLTLLVRGLFWIFSSLMAEAERESNPPGTVVGLVHPCDMDWDSEFCPGW